MAFHSKCSMYKLATMGLTVHGTGLGRKNMYCAGRTLITLHSTPPIMKKNMQRFCFVIGSFSLRATYL